MECIRSFLSGRWEGAQDDVIWYDWGQITRGIPQGSVLELLFFGYILMTRLKFYDTQNTIFMLRTCRQIYGHLRVTHFSEVVSQINSSSDLSAIREWAVDHDLRIK